MNERIITFSAHELILKDKLVHPEPAKLSIPDWYKKIPNPDDHLRLTLKACKPFLDSLVAGYILKNPVEQKIFFNTPDPNGKINTWVEVSTGLRNSESLARATNVNLGNETHLVEQLDGAKCPYVRQNQSFNIYKIMNPWTVTVPSGYSVLYLPPMNRYEDRFEIFAGIVDGPCAIPTNFPCVFKKQGSWILKKGESVATVFPFKRENWKMKLTKKSEKNQASDFFRLGSVLRKWYENTVWKKKTWK